MNEYVYDENVQLIYNNIVLIQELNNSFMVGI